MIHGESQKVITQYLLESRFQNSNYKFISVCKYEVLEPILGDPKIYIFQDLIEVDRTCEYRKRK